MSQLIVEESSNYAVIKLKGQFLGGEETDYLRDLLSDIISNKNISVILDLEKATYLNSSALGVLIAAHTNFARQQKKIILVGLNKQLEAILVSTKLNTVLEIADTIENSKNIINNSTLTS